MLHNLSSFKKRCIIGGFLVLVVIAGVLIYKSQSSKDTLKLSEFKTDEIYCYQGISWGTAESEVEEKLGVSLEQNAAAPNYFTAGTLTYSGYTIPCTLSFKEQGLNSIDFQFPSAENDPSVDYSRVEEKILKTFEKEYGEFTEQSEQTLIDGRNLRSTKWFSEEDDPTSFLFVDAYYNSQRVTELLIATGEAVPEALNNAK